MKVKAKHWLNYNGVWYKGGEEFEVEDIEQVKDYVDPVEFVSDVFPPDEVPNEAPKRRGRPKK